MSVLLSSYSKWTLCWILVQGRSNPVLNVFIPLSSNHYFFLIHFLDLAGKRPTTTSFNIRQLNFVLGKILLVPASKSPLACGNKMSALQWNLTTERIVSHVIPLVGISFSLPWVTLGVAIPVHQCDIPSFPICVAQLRHYSNTTACTYTEASSVLRFSSSELRNNKCMNWNIRRYPCQPGVHLQQ